MRNSQLASQLLENYDIFEKNTNNPSKVKYAKLVSKLDNIQNDLLVKDKEFFTNCESEEFVRISTNFLSNFSNYNLTIEELGFLILISKFINYGTNVLINLENNLSPITLVDLSNITRILRFVNMAKNLGFNWCFFTSLSNFILVMLFFVLEASLFNKTTNAINSRFNLVKGLK